MHSSEFGLDLDTKTGYWSLYNIESENEKEKLVSRKQEKWFLLAHRGMSLITDEDSLFVLEAETEKEKLVGRRQENNGFSQHMSLITDEDSLIVLVLTLKHIHLI